MKNFCLMVCSVVALLFSLVVCAGTVKIWDEEVLTKVNDFEPLVVTNLFFNGGDGLFDSSEWYYSSGDRRLVGIRRTSRKLESRLSGLDKRRMMTSVQGKFIPRENGSSSVLTLKDDNRGELSYDEGLEADLRFIEVDGQDQMVVDIHVSNEYIRRYEQLDENRETGCGVECQKLADFIVKAFDLNAADLSTNGVGTCKLLVNGKYDGFRFARPRKIDNDRFNVITCAYGADGVLHKIELVKLVKGKEFARESEEFEASLEKEVVEKLMSIKGKLSRIEDDQGKVVTISKGSLRFEIEKNSMGLLYGTISMTVELVR